MVLNSQLASSYRQRDVASDKQNEPKPGSIKVIRVNGLKHPGAGRLLLPDKSSLGTSISTRAIFRRCLSWTEYDKGRSALQFDFRLRCVFRLHGIYARF